MGNQIALLRKVNAYISIITSTAVSVGLHLSYRWIRSLCHSLRSAAANLVPLLITISSRVLATTIAAPHTACNASTDREATTSTRDRQDDPQHRQDFIEITFLGVKAREILRRGLRRPIGSRLTVTTCILALEHFLWNIGDIPKETHITRHLDAVIGRVRVSKVLHPVIIGIVSDPLTVGSVDVIVVIGCGP